VQRAVEIASEWFQIEDNPEKKIEAGLILLNNAKLRWFIQVLEY
jgi:hypothetical protein